MPNKPITSRESLAWEFAKEKHKGQMRKFLNKTYFDAHVQKVNGTVKMYTTDEDTLVLALIHDVAEDCYKNKWEAYPIIEDLFGKHIADDAMWLAIDKDEVKYKYHGNKSLYLIDKMIAMPERPLTVKLSDRFNNIADAFTADEKFRTKYYYHTVEVIRGIEKIKFNKVQTQIFEDIVAKTANVKKVFNLK